jgi:hypothetical protein
MKTNSALFAILSVGILISCEDRLADEPGVSPGSNALQFETATHSITENSGTQSLKINLAKPAAVDGSVVIEVTSQNLNGFVTSPAAVNGKLNIPVLKGSTIAEFSVTSVNDSIFNGNKSVAFRILSVSKELTIGETRQSVVTITEDEEMALVGFLGNSSSVTEGNNASAIRLVLSRAAAGVGDFRISLESDDAEYGKHYTTIPPATGGQITIPVTYGLRQTEIKIIPVNDTRISANRHIALTITSVSGSISAGEMVAHAVTLKDDELNGISHGYSTSAGAWNVKRYFGYREDGLVSKVLWEQYTPDYTGGSYEYHYAGTQLQRMTESNGSETIYTTDNGRIVKAERFSQGVLKQYTMYGYDDAGNVGEAAVFYRQPTGEMKMGLIFVYLYFNDGNIFKKLTYNPVEGGEPALISTETYENYIAKENPFPMVEILPNKPTQSKLPGTYRIERDGEEIVYQLNYDFDSAGRLRQRTSTASGTHEVSTYSYFREPGETSL